MDKLAFWKQKLIQFLHDPPAKPYASYPGGGGHVRIARELLTKIVGQEIRFCNRLPDFAAAGSDRPVVGPPRGKGVSPIQKLWPSDPVFNHPLSRARISANRAGQSAPSAGSTAKDVYLEDQAAVAEASADPLPDWADAQRLRSDFLRVWRRFRDDLIDRCPESGADPLVWQQLPADSRCPDHSLWDHLKVTSALAFLNDRKTVDPAREPWLFRFSIRGVQSFIQDSRTSRDLWVSSFLLADLIWHAMLPIVERYGPDCILYPELRGNPRADAWLQATESEALPKGKTDYGTFAAVLPNTFTAVLPRGAPDHDFLKPLEELADLARQRYRERWKQLAETVRRWFSREVGSGSWEDIWERQHRNVLSSSWCAVQWRRLEAITAASSLEAPALPAQRPRPAVDPNDLEAIQNREQRLRPWVDDQAWAAYERARGVYARTNLQVHQLERGFDYALTHHQLVQRHRLRNLNGDDVAVTDEPGEKCTLCRRRQALSNFEGLRLHGARRETTRFWKAGRLNPDRDRTDRLCAVCSMKRFLVEAGIEGETLTGLNPYWAGTAESKDAVDGDGRVRVPFPSTATLAAQDFLAHVVGQERFRGHLKRIVEAYRKTDLPQNSFPRSLKSLAAHAERDPVARGFLRLDTQSALFPEIVDGHIQRAKGDGDTSLEASLKALREAVKRLRDAVADSTDRESGEAARRPGTLYAVIRMDGDSMSRLLLGDAKQIGATWQDVLHPAVVKKLRQNAVTIDAGWPDLLRVERLLGPSLHAFVSRALGEFAHRIVPWVVESEFSGRLVYVGGDDLLCLAPATEALNLAARLQQLFSAPWIVDTQPKQESWSWRRKIEEHKTDSARERFVIPVWNGPSDAIRFPIEEAAGVQEHVDGHRPPHRFDPDQCELLPMLGGSVSMSAGIAYGHYKTSLGLMLRQSKRMLEDFAKETMGRSAVGLSHYSRNGVKTEFGLKWNPSPDPTSEPENPILAVPEPKSAHWIIDQARIGFAPGGPLSGSLPYKLRELNPVLRPILGEWNDKAVGGEGPSAMDRSDLRTLISGLFQNACGQDPASRKAIAAASAYQLWLNGLALAQRTRRWEQTVDGLLLARMLAGAGEEE